MFLRKSTVYLNTSTAWINVSRIISCESTQLYNYNCLCNPFHSVCCFNKFSLYLSFSISLPPSYGHIMHSFSFSLSYSIPLICLSSVSLSFTHTRTRYPSRSLFLTHFLFLMLAHTLSNTHTLIDHGQIRTLNSRSEH